MLMRDLLYRTLLMRDLYYGDHALRDGRARRALAALLRAAGRGLDALATRLAPANELEATDPVLEFYGEAGAPEGALYIDGRLVGHVQGVNRL